MGRKRTKTSRKKGSGNRGQTDSRASGKQQSAYADAPDVEPRTCICALHEQFWVTVESKQVYALPACRKREHDRVKKVAFRQFMYDGLRRLGMTAKAADALAHRALTHFYTRFIKLLKQLGWAYSPPTATWVKGNLRGNVV